MIHTFKIPMLQEEYNLGIVRLNNTGILDQTKTPSEINYKGVTATIQYDPISSNAIFSLKKTPFFATASYVESQIREYIQRLRELKTT